MNTLHQSEDFAAHNEQSLQALVRAIRLSQGEFSLTLLHCNYGNLQQDIVQKLGELSPIKIREIRLLPAVKTLYTSILAELKNEKPNALMVFGLESVTHIDTVLTSANQVREEFRKNFPFPILLWVNDQVMQKLLTLATDLKNWATTITFENTTDDLVNLLEKQIDDFFAGNATPNPQICWELETAQKDLEIRGQPLTRAVQASSEFIVGWNDYLSNQIETALAKYHSSLAFWQEIQHLQRQGILLYYIALAYFRQAEQNTLDSQKYLEESKRYLQQALDIFDQGKHPDLVAKYISKLGEVLRHLKHGMNCRALLTRLCTCIRIMAINYNWLKIMVFWQKLNYSIHIMRKQIN